MRKTISLMSLTIIMLLVRYAGGMEIGGYLKPYTFIAWNDIEYDLLATRFQLEIQDNLSGKFGYYVALDFDYRMEREKGQILPSYLKIYPVEAYLDIFTDRLDIRLGQQFIFWGKTDWVNPTDNINPWDYLHMSSEIEDYRIPVTALNLKYYLGSYTLQAVAVPGFEPDRVPAPFDSVKYPSADLNNTQFGIRLSGYLGVFDFSLSYYRGFDHFYTMGVLTQAMGPPIFFLEYEPIQVYGADFITTFNRFALKWEGAYTATADENGTDIYVKNSNFKHVLGLDYLPDEKTSFNLQMIQEILFDYDRGREDTMIAQAGVSDYLWAQKEISYSLSARIKRELVNFVDFQLVGVYNLEQEDSFLLSFINWQPADAFNFTVGAVLFAGPERSVFGRMADEDRLFLQLKLNF